MSSGDQDRLGGDHDERGHGHDQHGHGHDHGSAVLAEGSARGIRALRTSTIGLALTAAIQVAVVAVAGSAALLADALHNIGDVLTTVALWIAFVATRRAADDKYTFGYQRFEDLAGGVIIVAIFASGALAIWESAQKLVRGEAPRHVVAAILASAVGVVGNEIVAQIKIREGRRIDSPALVAEGQHSRADGLVSVGAVVGLSATAYGYEWADAVAGLAIGLVILVVAFTSGRPIVAKLVDRIDPAVVEALHAEAAAVDGVEDVHDVRARYAGRALYVLLHISADPDLPLREAHRIAEGVRTRILERLPQVVQVDVHVDPSGPQDEHHGPAATKHPPDGS